MVLVSILGDFHSSILPVLYEYKDKIKTHILIYDDYKPDVKNAQDIIVGIEKFKEKYNLDFTHANYKIDEDSKNSIENLENIFQQHCNTYEELYINSTDGHASINTLLSVKLIPKGINIITYDKYDNEINIINKDEFKTLSFSNSVPVKDHFLLRNIYCEYENRKRKIMKHKANIKTIFQKHLDQYLNLRKENYKSYKNESNELVNIVNQLIEEFEPDNIVKFVQGSLYELYITSLIMDCGVDDVEVGVTIYKDNDKKIYNEFDVLFVKDNHLHMIECKMTASTKLSDLIYKYLALKELLDDDGKLGIFTKHDDYYRKVGKALPDNESLPKLRAKESDILTRGLVYNNEEKFFEDLKEFFDIDKAN
jgi:hypothetical protein